VSGCIIGGNLSTGLLGDGLGDEVRRTRGNGLNNSDVISIGIGNKMYNGITGGGGSGGASALANGGGSRYFGRSVHSIGSVTGGIGSGGGVGGGTNNGNCGVVATINILCGTNNNSVATSGPAAGTFVVIGVGGLRRANKTTGIFRHVIGTTSASSPSITSGITVGPPNICGTGGQDHHHNHYHHHHHHHNSNSSNNNNSNNNNHNHSHHNNNNNNSNNHHTNHQYQLNNQQSSHHHQQQQQQHTHSHHLYQHNNNNNNRDEVGNNNKMDN